MRLLRLAARSRDYWNLREGTTLHQPSSFTRKQCHGAQPAKTVRCKRADLQHTRCYRKVSKSPEYCPHLPTGLLAKGAQDALRSNVRPMAKEYAGLCGIATNDINSFAKCLPNNRLILTAEKNRSVRRLSCYKSTQRNSKR